MIWLLTLLLSTSASLGAPQSDPTSLKWHSGTIRTSESSSRVIFDTGEGDPFEVEGFSVSNVGDNSPALQFKNSHNQHNVPLPNDLGAVRCAKFKSTDGRTFLFISTATHPANVLVLELEAKPITIDLEAGFNKIRSLALGATPDTLGKVRKFKPKHGILQSTVGHKFQTNFSQFALQANQSSVTLIGYDSEKEELDFFRQSLPPSDASKLPTSRNGRRSPTMRYAQIQLPELSLLRNTPPKVRLSADQTSLILDTDTHPIEFHISESEREVTQVGHKDRKPSLVYEFGTDRIRKQLNIESAGLPMNELALVEKQVSDLLNAPSSSATRRNVRYSTISIDDFTLEYLPEAIQNVGLTALNTLARSPRHTSSYDTVYIDTKLGTDLPEALQHLASAGDPQSLLFVVVNDSSSGIRDKDFKLQSLIDALKTERLTRILILMSSDDAPEDQRLFSTSKISDLLPDETTALGLQRALEMLGVKATLQQIRLLLEEILNNRATKATLPAKRIARTLAWAIENTGKRNVPQERLTDEIVREYTRLTKPSANTPDSLINRSLSIATSFVGGRYPSLHGVDEILETQAERTATFYDQSSERIPFLVNINMGISGTGKSTVSENTGRILNSGLSAKPFESVDFTKQGTQETLDAIKEAVKVLHQSGPPGKVLVLDEADYRPEVLVALLDDLDPHSIKPKKTDFTGILVHINLNVDPDSVLYKQLASISHHDHQFPNLAKQFFVESMLRTEMNIKKKSPAKSADSAENTPDALRKKLLAFVDRHQTDLFVYAPRRSEDRPELKVIQGEEKRMGIKIEATPEAAKLIQSIMNRFPGGHRAPTAAILEETDAAFSRLKRGGGKHPFAGRYQLGVTTINNRERLEVIALDGGAPGMEVEANYRRTSDTMIQQLAEYLKLKGSQFDHSTNAHAKASQQGRMTRLSTFLEGLMTASSRELFEPTDNKNRSIPPRVKNAQQLELPPHLDLNQRKGLSNLLYEPIRHLYSEVSKGTDLSRPESSTKVVSSLQSVLDIVGRLHFTDSNWISNLSEKSPPEGRSRSYGSDAETAGYVVDNLLRLAASEQYESKIKAHIREQEAGFRLIPETVPERAPAHFDDPVMEAAASCLRRAEPFLVTKPKP